MVRNFKIQCPSCRSTCELYLSTDAHIVILNCPNCGTPMLHNDDGVFLLSQRQIDELARSRGLSILSLLEKVASYEFKDKKFAIAAAGDDQSPSTISASVPATSFPVREAITTDDVLDLRIELGTCTDSQDFISRI